MDQADQADQALKQAIRQVGSRSALARAIGVTPQAVQQWRRVPAVRVLDVERASDGVVSRHQLRPDIYAPTPTPTEG